MTMQMDRRGILAGGLAAGAFATTPASAQARPADAPLPDGGTDRAYALALLRRMAEPVLGRMARGRLHAEWTPELSPTWDGRNPGVARSTWRPGIPIKVGGGASTSTKPRRPRA